MTGRFLPHFQHIHDLIEARIGQGAFARGYPELLGLADGEAHAEPLAALEAMLSKMARHRERLDMHLFNAAKRDLHQLPHVAENTLGHSNIAHAELYSRAAAQELLASEAMEKVTRFVTKNRGG